VPSRLTSVRLKPMGCAASTQDPGDVSTRKSFHRQTSGYLNGSLWFPGILAAPDAATTPTTSSRTSASSRSSSSLRLSSGSTAAAVTTATKLLDTMSVPEIRAIVSDLIAEGVKNEVVSELIRSEPGIMEAAAKKAAIAQERVVGAAEHASTETKAKVGANYTSCGGSLLEPLVKQSEMKLVDVNYLIALAEAGGAVPPYSNVPDCARITANSLWRLRSWNVAYSLPVLIISCASTTPDSASLSLL
jgi:hypothetical protein